MRKDQNLSKTFVKDLFTKFGIGKPFVVEQFGQEYIITFVSVSVVHIENFIGEYEEERQIIDENKFPESTLVDWFEEPKQSVNLCSCDFHTVVMVTGCVCGGH